MPATSSRRSSHKKRKLEHVSSPVKVEEDVVMEDSSSDSSSSEEEDKAAQSEKEEESETEEEKEEENEEKSESESEEEEEVVEVKVKMEEEEEESEEEEQEEQETVNRKTDSSSDSSDSEEESAPVVETKQERSDSSESEEEEVEEEVKPRQPVKVHVPTEEKPKKKKKEKQAKQPKEEEPKDEGENVNIRLKAVRRLLEPFSKEQLVEIMANAATQYDELYADLKAAAGSDMAHRKVFVRELAGETTSEKLKDSFAGFGDIEEASVDFDKPTGKSSGCGFVTFTDMETAQRVVQTKTIVIDGRKVLCHLAAVRADGRQWPHGPPPEMMYMMPGPGGYPTMGMPIPGHGFPSHPMQMQPQMPPQQESPSINSDGRKLFVYGLGSKTTDEAFREEFEKFGELEAAYVPRERDSDKAKGYAFVTYREKAGADRALDTPTKKIAGKTATCILASERKNKTQHEQGPMGQNFPMPMMPMGMYPPMPFPGMPPMQPDRFPPPGPFGPPPHMFGGRPPLFRGRPLKKRPQQQRK